MEDAVSEVIDYVIKEDATAKSEQTWVVDVSEPTKQSASFIMWPDSRFGIHINPVVTLMTTVLIWSLIAVCLTNPEKAFKNFTLGEGTHQWVVDTFSWFFIASKGAWLLFILVLFCSKYGRLKLAPTDDCQPDFDTATWFMMLFTCGVGCELFFFGVSEPVSHYSGTFPGFIEGFRNRHSDASMDDREAWALELTTVHWGVHAWVVFAISGLTIGFLAHRKGLPMTLRCCFYPFLGDKIFGFPGDVIDTMGAIGTMLGISVVLAQGALDLNTILARLSGCAGFTNSIDCDNNSRGKCRWQDYGRCKNVSADQDVDALGFDVSQRNQYILIWTLTAVASISAVLGLNVGIRTISVFSFMLGTFALFYVFIVGGNAWYFLDVLTQQFGMYVQQFAGATFHTDAFARHSTVGGVANPHWLAIWTMFYNGVWASWAPFAGMFIAKISRGRTIREFIIGAIITPSVFMFIWFNVFGASGIDMERTAELVGLNGTQSPTYLLKPNKTSPVLNLCPLEESTGRPAAGKDCIYASRLSERPLSG
eukprot:GEMP01004414.1.p1 GENE.GEMP01004414.1~~GEMP01004414.1.p1  ORF type:complete len:543 (+),score=71.89 GEMP01004414.1:23-1630(+)